MSRQQPPILRLRKKHVPDDIVLDILLRLPVKSLLRFRCVSKSWYSQITSSNFMSSHRNNMLTHNDNHDDHGYVIHIPSCNSLYMNSFSSLNGQVCTVACDRTFEKMYDLRIPFTFHSGFAHLVGSCNGILCLTDYRTNRHSVLNDVFLWNPSIRMFKRLSGTCFRRRRLRDFQLGFAYHSQNNDFKVVRISKHFRNAEYPPGVEVYTLSSDSGKRIELGISWRPNVLIYNFNCGFSFPFVSGHLHWLLDITEGSGQHKYRSDMILSFDVNSEKFREIPLPDDDSFKGVNFEKCLTSFKEKLALIQFRGCLQPHVTVCFVWVMKEYGVLESWNKLYEVPIENLTIFSGFTKYGTLIIRTNSGLVEGIEEEDKFVLIDPKTLHEQDISIQLNYPLDVATLHVSTSAYMENLALLDGANVVSY